MTMPAIIIGHAAYTSSNAQRVHRCVHGAVIDLVRRGIQPKRARAAVNAAVARPNSTEVLINTARRAVVEVRCIL